MAIYFVATHDRAFVKIGYSKWRHAARIKEISRHHPLPLVTLAVLWGGREVEQHLHKRLAHLRMRGEWFRNGAEVQREIVRARSASSETPSQAWLACDWLLAAADDLAQRKGPTRFQHGRVETAFANCALSTFAYSVALAIAASAGLLVAPAYCATVIDTAGALILRRRGNLSSAEAEAVASTLEAVRRRWRLGED